MKTYKISFLLNLLLSAVATVFLLASCAQKNYSTQTQYKFRSKDKKPDYDNLNYWAAHPWKKDLSDSVPKPLRGLYKQDSLADVFFIHPTTLTSLQDERWNADIDDAEINSKTDYSSILYQASVFNEKCRVFAPRYRQAHIKSFYQHGATADTAFEIAYADVKAAFFYYLQNYHNGQPIIIASHSQGTKHAGRLLKEFFENKPLQNNLVCAYIIGMPIPENYFSTLNPCKDSLSTGCFVAWRTFKSGSAEPDFIVKETFKSVVVNPLSWTITTDLIPSSYNRGGILRNYNKIVPAVVNAQIHDNILWSSKPDVPGKIFFRPTNYHVGDINLFYMNIRENVLTRINSYQKN